jgi:GntR family transcriptional regulator
VTSTMYLMELDRSGPVPLHDQVAADIRRAIAEGEAAPGERLPLVKDIAAVLGVNKNTVLRAMHILRDEGLLEFRRGRGITVVGTPEQSDMLREVGELVAYAQHHGYSTAEVIEMIKSISTSNARSSGGAT